MLGVGAWACGKPGPAALDANIKAEKVSDLILLTDRPPNLETPLHYFSTDLTPNEAFFVRWHLSGVPTSIDLRTWRLKIGGHVEHPVELSLDDLKKLEPVTTVAVNQCSGTGRSLFSPRVPGVQWGRGAMGNAKWKGVRLKDVLAKAGVKAGAIDVSVRGLDRAPLATVPEFVKSLDLAHAQDGEVLVAYEMNDAPLPMLNGFPARLVVPGYYSTYWTKSLDQIDVLPNPFEGYWIKKAYRIPANPAAEEDPASLSKDTTPIGKMNVQSVVVKPERGEQLHVNASYKCEGVAFDGGTGIAKVEVSTDGGVTWLPCELGPDLGRYSFRRFRFNWTPNAAGPASLRARATSVGGETQPDNPRWNRAGYMKNHIEPVDVTVIA